MTVTDAQKRLLEYIHGTSRKLYGSGKDFPAKIARRDTISRAMVAGLIDPPRVTDTGTWEITAAGRQAIGLPSPPGGRE